MAIATVTGTIITLMATITTITTATFPAACNGSFTECSSWEAITGLVCTGDVAVTCTKDATDGNGAITVAYVLGLSAGSSNSVAQRTMQSGSEILRYNVYVNSVRTTVWGDTDPLKVSGSVKLTNARPQITNNHAAYGRAPAAQDVRAGAYADTLILTMTF